MARYTGPSCKLCRREGVKLFLKGERCTTQKCSINRRNYPPGAQGQRGFKKLSEYAKQLREKQKAKRIFGLQEKVFKSYFKKASNGSDITGDALLKLLERRLDNVVYRGGFATSRAQARQIVSHGLLMLNGKKADIASIIVKKGDIVSIKENKADKTIFVSMTERLKSNKKKENGWLNLDTKKMNIEVIRLPEKTDIDSEIQSQLIVEYYSKA